MRKNIVFCLGLLFALGVVLAESQYLNGSSVNETISKSSHEGRSYIKRSDNEKRGR